MARKTNEELKQEIVTLQKNQQNAIQVANNCRDQIMIIEHVLKDRAEAEKESQFDTCIPKLENNEESTSI
mgnify:CR=1 FL=1